MNIKRTVNRTLITAFTALLVTLVVAYDFERGNECFRIERGMIDNLYSMDEVKKFRKIYYTGLMFGFNKARPHRYYKVISRRGKTYVSKSGIPHESS